MQRCRKEVPDERLTNHASGRMASAMRPDGEGGTGEPANRSDCGFARKITRKPRGGETTSVKKQRDHEVLNPRGGGGAAPAARNRRAATRKSEEVGRSRPRNAKQKGRDAEERGGGGAAPAARNRRATMRKSEEVAEPPPQRETEGQRYGRARRWRSRPRSAKQKGRDTEERGGGGAAPATRNRRATIRKSEEVAEPPPQRETEGQRYGRARRWRSRPRNAQKRGRPDQDCS